MKGEVVGTTSGDCGRSVHVQQVKCCFSPMSEGGGACEKCMEVEDSELSDATAELDKRLFTGDRKTESLPFVCTVISGGHQWGAVRSPQT